MIKLKVFQTTEESTAALNTAIRERIFSESDYIDIRLSMPPTDVPIIAKNNSYPKPFKAVLKINDEGNYILRYVGEIDLEHPLRDTRTKDDFLSNIDMEVTKWKVLFPKDIDY